MKSILIVGSDSYIGTSFAAFAGSQYNITTADTRDNHRQAVDISTADARGNHWQTVDMSAFDTVLHVAGIAHVKQKKKMKNLYNQVNAELPVSVARQAKTQGVKQFIFLSSMSVYGKKRGEITADTIPNPTDFYGKSKYKAEQELLKLDAPDFRVCIIRPPMVYGAGCKGNFPKLEKLAARTPVFPAIANQRSMIFIGNLCAFLCLQINNNNSGTHTPQNNKYVNTAELVQLIAACRNKKIRITRLLNPLARLLAAITPSADKLFGSLFYRQSGQEHTYNTIPFQESIKKSIGQSVRTFYAKRLMDLAAVIISAPLWLPLMLILATIVKATSPGPVFFKQKRYGKDRRFFQIYKFRSMYTDAPKDVPTHLLRDPQSLITPFGRFLRKSSLDELPQLFNILKGEISLVGPRPALWNQEDLIAEREKYNANAIPVGLTGLAQISGRDELPIPQKAAYDGEYARTISLWLDIKILFRTVFGVFLGKGVKEGGG